jgi:hypothetical protein
MDGGAIAKRTPWAKSHFLDCSYDRSTSFQFLVLLDSLYLPLYIQDSGLEWVINQEISLME